MPHRALAVLLFAFGTAWLATPARAGRPAPFLAALADGPAEEGGGGNATTREALLRAAFLFSFVKYVDWPRDAAADAELRVGVIGRDPLGAALDSLGGRHSRGRVVRVARPDGPAAAVACHVLYVGAMEPVRRDALLAAARGRPVLTVGEEPGFAERGGIIELVRRENRLRFQLNLERAEEAGLQLSVQLVRLADAVVAPGAPPPE